MKAQVFLSGLLLSLVSVSASAAGWQTISDADWDSAAVRRVLQTFAFGGGHISEAEIQHQADLAPDIAIKNLLNFAVHNPILSPSKKNFSYPLNQENLMTLGQFLASNHPQNPIAVKNRKKFLNYKNGQLNPAWTWLYSTLARGYNPFRQKIGFWETNYHLAVNVKAGVSGNQLGTYYDNILTSLADPAQPYQFTLAQAAGSAAIAVQYGHHKNVFKNGKCECNEDFAREYHQLFFGILGDNDSEYHENISIKNTANVLTGIKISGKSAAINHTGAHHYQGELDILHQKNLGNNSGQRLQLLSDLAIEHAESLANLPVKIIQQLADDNLTPDKIVAIRAEWEQMQPKNLLNFLQKYAISSQFHSASRYKYTTALERHLRLLNQLVLNDSEIFYYLRPNLFNHEGMKLFRPAHNVFGGQTSEEASNSSLIFLSQYNLSTADNQYFTRIENAKWNWKKDWSQSIPSGLTYEYQVDKVGELLWQRLIGDNLKNYGVLERAHVNSLLAQGLDLMQVLKLQTETNSDIAQILLQEASKQQLQQLSATKLGLNSANVKHKKQANWRIGLAISFISATPYMFVNAGG